MRDATPWYAFDTHVGSYQEERGLRIARSMFDCTLYRVPLLPCPPTTFPSLPVVSLPLLSPTSSVFVDFFRSRFLLAISIRRAIRRSSTSDNDTPSIEDR